MSFSWEYRTIATIAKTHGRRGEVVAVASDGLPPVLQEGLEVAIVPPALKGPRRYTVRHCSGEGPSRLVSFAEVSDLDGASKLVGKSLLVHVDDLPSGFELRDVQTWLGREVRDVRLGVLGTIQEVLQSPAQDVWMVDGPYGEVLIPAVEDFVVKVDEDGAVCVKVPRGLVREGD